MRRFWNVGTAAVLGLLTLVAFAGTAHAVATGSTDPDTVVVITGDVVVPDGQQVDNVIVIDGDVVIAGRAHGEVFVVNGDVTVAGRADDDVVSLNGRVTLRADARVEGDVVSKDPARIADGATVGGEVDRARDRFALGRLGAIGRVFLWVAATVSSFVLGAILLLVSPRAAEAIADAGRTAAGPAIGLGFALAIGVPILGVLLTVSILGLPLGLAILLGLALLYGLGYAVGALFLGRLILQRPKNLWLAFLLGWGILRVVAIVPLLGAFVAFAAVVYGLGCIAVAVYRSRRATPDSDVLAPTPVP